jgi:hypothetical protein
MRRRVRLWCDSDHTTMLTARAGDVSEDTDCDMLAAYYSAVARGLAVQARDGGSREKLAEIGRLAMLAWPASDART